MAANPSNYNPRTVELAGAEFATSPIVTPASKAAVTAVAAGGTGAAAGGWDTAPHRDTVTAAVNTIGQALEDAGIVTFT